MTPALLLQYLTGAGAILCAIAYAYGCIWRSKGDRRFHVAGLMFTGMALATLAIMMPTAAAGSGLFASGVTSALIMAAAACQSIGACRGRRGDRRSAVEEEVAEDLLGQPEVRQAA